MNYKRRKFLQAALILCAVTATAGSAHASVMGFPGLLGIRFWEYSGGPLMFNFAPASPQMLNQLATLSPISNDFVGVPTEPYDVFYSDSVGNLDINGNYVTVEARYDFANAGGGLNLAAVDLLLGNAANPTICRADIWASSVGQGPNYIAGSEALAVDPADTTAVPTTFTTMGSTVAGSPTRLRVTVGWTCVPEPAAGTLATLGLLTAGARTRRRS